MLDLVNLLIIRSSHYSLTVIAELHKQRDKTPIKKVKDE